MSEIPTNQLFANIYLNEFDNWIKRELKQKFYVRYMVYFVIFSNNKQELKDILLKIKEYLKIELKIRIEGKGGFDKYDYART